MSKKKTMTALELLKTNKSVAERAENYVISAKRNIQKDVIDTLNSKKEGIEDELFELTNFNLETNVNLGLNEMTRTEVEKRFKQIIDLEYKLVLLEMEIKTKLASFNKYFGNAEA
jgi:hypothetical protein